MKKLVLIFLLAGLCFPSGADGQSLWKNAFLRKTSGISSKEATRQLTITKKASKVLTARKKASIQKAQEACQGSLSGCVLYGESPIKKIKGWPFLFSSSGPYDDNKMLQWLSRSAKKDYFVAAHNRAAVKAVSVRKKALERMQGEKIRLVSGFYSPSVRKPAAEELANVLTENHKYIFLGEMHNFPEIQKTIEQFLVHYRARFPEKQIIFLTEFLPSTETETYRRRLARVFSPYADVWRMAEVQKMSVVGLDPLWLFKHDSPVMWVLKNNMVEKEQMWYSLEITRQRNQLWKQQIDALRAQYPDAVFIFHTGATHVDYTEPFTLSKQFPQKETFVATFYPYEKHGSWVARCDLLDAFNPSLFAWRKMIVWQDADLARIAGFNARFKIAGRP